MTLKIGPIQNDELLQLVDISRKTFYDTFGEHNSKEEMQFFLDSSFSAEALKLEMSLSSNHFFFAKFDSEIAGYLKLSTAESSEIDEKDVLEISRIYVVKEKHGSGIGKSLLQFAISFAKEQSKKVIFLGVWEHNERAISFYKNFGFEKFGEHIFMVGSDPQTDWLMKRQVEESKAGGE